MVKPPAHHQCLVDLAVPVTSPPPESQFHGTGSLCATFDSATSASEGRPRFFVSAPPYQFFLLCWVDSNSPVDTGRSFAESLSVFQFLVIIHKAAINSCTQSLG